LLSSHSPSFRTVNSPEGFAQLTTTLLTNHLSPGQVFAQDQVGALSSDPVVGAGSALENWDRTEVEEVPLSLLERIYKRKHSDRALRLLNRKLRIRVDDHYVLPVANSIFRLTSRLDFFAAVPRLPGLSVILPPVHVTPPSWWKFTLDFRFPYRHFNFKHGKLGFRPDHACCFIGSTDSLDIWVIFVPDDKLDNDTKTLPAGSTFSKPTQLSPRHLRQFLSWMLFCLSAIKYPGLHLRSNRRYSINLDQNPPNWSFATDFTYASLFYHQTPYSFH
jgi:hypothetical protein